MEWNEVIENLKYLISEDCTDTQFDYQDEIEIAIRVMESQEDLRSKIDKAIEELCEKVKNRGFLSCESDYIQMEIKNIFTRNIEG